MGSAISVAGIRAGSLALLCSLPLAGCMTQGSSSFVDALDVRGQQAAAADPVPFDVAGASASGVVDATRTQAVPKTASVPPAAYAEPAIETRVETAISQTAAEPVVQTSLAAEQARHLAEIPASSDVGARYAALTPVAAAASAELNDPAALAAGELFVDPLELAAEERANALYANLRHGECKGGWGPKPKMLNARRIDPSHKFYMEMRLRHTPPLPVGHVYIAYGRIGPDGEPLDEKLVMLAPVGGYAGATMAAAAPMPGVLEPYGDDCVLRPIAAYRHSLTAQQYEKLLLRIQQAKQEKPKYALWTYNCNHFMSDIAASVGILPPENKYTPSLEYFYAMMDRNEGRKVARSPREDTAELASAQAFPAR